MLLHAPSPALTLNGPAPDLADLADLTGLTRRVAADVRAGIHEVHVDPDHRWYKRLHGNDFVDVWLISWATEQAAELHDHAGSLGALTVVTGRLTEEFWSVPDTGLRTRTLHAGRSVGFGPGHVHEVSNPSADPAVSVHAYSPPLTAMSYYDVTGGRLRRVRSELTEPGSTQGVG
ncbi:cysteine dioxygenase [Pseudonocardia sulfidoxydans NBRC 16205]|uniref:Cysteine dioxygenase n=1 Tax=Pseudonocardia sulfidoxydans NBRC 16205 TaxID=1223511 RepID=A0A511DLA5_9PSEU|nr:cysteine dioxygenase family protein [Pseudonocardia sulfidoxydans]GEL25589.1 cysteine dioxygenase [Pseudonocardia sulfidoxydans NBRC 16205]